jgi:hypothetical protein
MATGEKSTLLNDALRYLDDANQRVGMAILYRDFAADGEVERALIVKERLEALPPASAARAQLCKACAAPASAKVFDLAERFPQFGRLASLLTIVQEAEAV